MVQVAPGAMPWLRKGELVKRLMVSPRKYVASLGAWTQRTWHEASKARAESRKHDREVRLKHGWEPVHNRSSSNAHLLSLPSAVVLAAAGIVIIGLLVFGDELGPLASHFVDELLTRGD